MAGAVPFLEKTKGLILGSLNSHFCGWGSGLSGVTVSLFNRTVEGSLVFCINHYLIADILGNWNVRYHCLYGVLEEFGGCIDAKDYPLVLI